MDNEEKGTYGWWFLWMRSLGVLPADVVLGQLHGLCRELLRLVPLVAVPQILPKLLWSQSKLFGQPVCRKKES